MSIFDDRRIGRLFGVDIVIHFTFFVFFGTLFLIDAWNGRWEMGLLIASVFCCIVAHEFGHIFAAYRCGIRTSKILLSMIGGMAMLDKEMPEQPLQEIYIAVCGPAVTLVIAAILLLFNNDTTETLAWINIFIACFNLIPALPLDGGRILRALMTLSLTGLFETFGVPMNQKDAYYVATSVGASVSLLVAVGFAVLGVLAGIYMLPVMGLFVWLLSRAELRELKEKRLAGAEGLTDISVAQKKS